MGKLLLNKEVKRSCITVRLQILPSPLQGSLWLRM